MGKQLLIIGFDGTHHAGLAKEITDLLCKRGLSVRHSSLRYGGTTTFATGGAADLKKELEEEGLPSAAIQEGLTGGMGDLTSKDGVTLETIKEQLDRIEAAQKKEGAAAKGPKEGKAGAAKKKGPEGKPEEGLLQEDLAGKSAQGDGAGAGDEKAAEGGDGADGQGGREQEANGTSETTAPTEEGEG